MVLLGNNRKWGKGGIKLLTFYAANPWSHLTCPTTCNTVANLEYFLGLICTTDANIKEKNLNSCKIASGACVKCISCSVRFSLCRDFSSLWIGSGHYKWVIFPFGETLPGHAGASLDSAELRCANIHPCQCICMDNSGWAMLAFKKACGGCRQATCIQNQSFHVSAANF